MEEEESSEISSSSSSYSSSEDESVGEEEDEDSEEEEAPAGPSRSGGATGEASGRRKRRRKLVGRRRELRSKYESVKDFNPEARSAQTEEIERIRRLELQRSLQAGTPSASRVATTPGEGEGEGELTSLLGGGAVFRNLAEDEEERERVVDAIVISSDSEEEEEEEERARRGEVGEGVREVKTEEGEGVKKEKGGRYDIVGEERDNQVVINLGHPPDEEDVTLPPQVARIIKPHQVEWEGRSGGKAYTKEKECVCITEWERGEERLRGREGEHTCVVTWFGRERAKCVVCPKVLNIIQTEREEMKNELRCREGENEENWS